MELNFDWIENWKTLNYAADLFVRAECLIVCVCVRERGKESARETNLKCHGILSVSENLWENPQHENNS